MLLGVDVGGTFTDAVLLAGGRVLTAKAPTTPRDQSEGVMRAVRAALEQAGAEPSEVAVFAHGMTVATNALLEGRVARIALVATEGFTDIVELGRQNRPELYRLCARGPEPLATPELRFAAPERMSPDGPLRALSDADAEAVADRVAAAGVDAVAVVLLHSYRHPEHELRLGEALARRAPRVSTHLSHETVGTFREYERAATTEVDAALSPLLSGYLQRLAARCADAGLPEPSIMQSTGGLMDVERAAGHAALTVLSGPAGGAAGAAFAARAAGAGDVLCFDMGGTSCDVCVVDRGQVQEQSGGTLAGRPIALPMLAVHTVGAGGGSIAWRDPGGALRVGPRSAGADPGPACYGRGGREPTVTDANVVLGHLDPAVPLAGGVTLDADAAERAIGELATGLGLTITECARGIRRVACAEMAAALRVVTVDRGVDPRRYALLAFGGAGPLHAADVADELQIDRILIPRASGVLAALGLVAAPQRRDVQRSVFLAGAELTAEAMRKHTAALAAQALATLGGSREDDRHGDGSLTITLETRYRGQSHELPIPAPAAATPVQLRELFEAEHERRYGYRDGDQELELVTIRVAATAPAPALELAGQADSTPIEGPTVIRLPESTLVVPAGWRGHTDRVGTIHLQRVQ
jgi:N-methylhydantoinase A/oxoprolinase/acetone carboxylase beta subunit